MSHLDMLEDAFSNEELISEPNKIIYPHFANALRDLINSSLAFKDEKYTMVDIEGLKRLQILKRAVFLDEPLTLSCKVRTENQQHNFNSEIILTPNNVLSYTRGNFKYEDTQENNYTAIYIENMGEKLKTHELLEKSFRKEQTSKETRI
jgi:hypothetical protein